MNSALSTLPSRLNPGLIFLLALILAATGILSTPIALLVGIAFGFLFRHPFPELSRTLSRFLLQASVVALGFGMNLHQVISTGKSGFVYTAISICGAIAVGLLLGKLFSVGGKSSYLITLGTAICGGSAIAAIAPILQPDDEELSVSLGTIFVLNAVALLLFPPIGWALHLSQPQFGLWAALAIHDTSSVVGAAARYGSQALAIATTVKLARALWIVPVALLTARFAGSKTKVKLPWFILFFCLAAVCNTYVPFAHSAFLTATTLGRTGLTVVLFLIGSGISRSTIRQVGFRPLLQGVTLWILVATITLFIILTGRIML